MVEPSAGTGTGLATGEKQRGPDLVTGVRMVERPHLRRWVGCGTLTPEGPEVGVSRHAAGCVAGTVSS